MIEQAASPAFRSLLSAIKKDNPHVKFVPGEDFVWSPATESIAVPPYSRGVTSCWSLIHELGHARLGHQTYKSDFELLKLEVEAWSEARKLAEIYGIIIDEDHIENCLDSYRDWLYLRSKCPHCDVNSLQIDPRHYRCHNCSTTWKVSASRFCRIHRQEI